MNDFVGLHVHVLGLQIAGRRLGDVRVGAVERGLQTVLNIAELRFVFALDSQLARCDVAGVGKSLDVLRFFGLGPAR